MSGATAKMANQDSAIRVSFYGRHPVTWLPDDNGEAGTAGDDQLKHDYAAYLRDRIKDLELQEKEDPEGDYMGDSKPELADKKKWLFALLAASFDPESKLMNVNEWYLFDARNANDRKKKFKQITAMLTNSVQELTASWGTGKKAGGQEGQEDVPAKKEKITQRRLAADLKAQREVPKWYGGRCVLSGFVPPQGAHIVPVRTLKKAGPREVWDLLEMFWPLPHVEELVADGRETSNVLPLCPDAHTLWDRYLFAIRPIQHHMDPDRRLFLQFVWLKDLDTEGGLVTGRGTQDAEDGVGIADFRRGGDGLCPFVQHGDIYEVATTDPEKCPLPDIRFLQIQYGVHKLMGGMRAAGALKSIFGGKPPDDDEDPVPGKLRLSHDWEFLLEAAVDEGILDDAAAKLWVKAIIRSWAERAELLGIPLGPQAEDASGAANEGEVESDGEDVKRG